jgi:redox-sensitive bicupin YhaK (pirin superfamily)
MIEPRPSRERGHAHHGWLDSYHSFSFADYYDPRYMGYASLRVINEDRVAPGAGFPTHSHRDMEILSYVLSGALEHKDSLGNGSVIRPGDVQRMSAGRGVSHSEFNASQSEPVHFLQIWILPARAGIAPSYEQRHYPETERRGQLRLIASTDGAEGSVRLNQDARVYASLLASQECVQWCVPPARHAYLQVARGALTVNHIRLAGGDGARISGEDVLNLRAEDAVEFLLFDLA